MLNNFMNADLFFSDLKHLVKMQRYIFEYFGFDLLISL